MASPSLAGGSEDKRMEFRIPAFGRSVLPSLLLALLAACGSGEPPQAPPPPAVTVAAPLVREVVDWDDYVGRFEAIESVEVKPRVSGYLQIVPFPRRRLCPRRPAPLHHRPAAGAGAARSGARPARPGRGHPGQRPHRACPLADAGGATGGEHRGGRAAAGGAAGRPGRRRRGARQCAGAGASTLGFTRVLAPISGRISERRVDPGNAVTADETVLTTIVSTDPLHFTFDGSEALLLRYQRAGRRPGRQRGPHPASGRSRLRPCPARLDFVDNAIDPASGTIQARAVVPNPDGFLRPGMIGHLQARRQRRPIGRCSCPTPPSSTDGVRRLVQVVDREGNVTGRPVVLGPLVGNLRVIRSGLGPRDRVDHQRPPADHARPEGAAAPGPNPRRRPAPSRRARRPARRARFGRHPGRRRRGAAMNISSFFIDRPIFASVIALFITLLGAFAYPALPLAQYPEIAPPSVAVVAAFPGRLGRDDGRDDRGADRAGGQRRRGHALHALDLEPGADLDHRHLPARHRHRYRAGAGPEPGRARRAAPARAGPPDRRHRHQAGDRLPDGRGADHDRSAISTSTMSAITPIRGCATGCCACRASARCRCSAAAIIRCASGSIPTGRRRAISPPTRS